MSGAAALPRVDVSAGDDEVARRIDAACREVGFFTVVGHGIDPGLQARMDTAARAFFARPEDEKATVAMAHGGRAWRGWFPLHGELTSGVPDHKEGVYFGREGPADGRPLHGPNLWPSDELRDSVTAWMDAMEKLAQRLGRAIGIALGLGPDWFAHHLTADPTVLFRIFRYPPIAPPVEGWGVAEHTDYGLLTLLAQDDQGGLQVHGPDGWIDVPPSTLVVNLGDMLDRMTEGRYRSTPHRVRPTAGDRDRLSFPFFFDPSWDAEVRPLPLGGEAPPEVSRWDGTSLRHLEGTYGDYLTAKVAKVFPDLASPC